jgi:hypothetical protein
MASLPRRINLEIGGCRLAVIHGGVDIINRFIFSSTASAIKLEEIRKTGADGIMAGHCGLPFTQAINGQLWHNAGAIGMPSNDGTPRGWFSVLSVKADGIVIEHCPLDYDYATAAAKIRGARLPEEYAASLETGLWPTCDVLPLKRDSRPRSGSRTRQDVLVASTSIGREISPQTLTGLHPALASRRPRLRAQKLQPGKVPSAPISTPRTVMETLAAILAQRARPQ